MALLFGAPKMRISPLQERRKALLLDEAPAVVEATVNKKEAFGKLLEEAIDEAFSSLGESPRKAIYMYLKNKFGIAEQEIPDRINDFSDALKKIFGPGARNLEILFIRNIQAKARIDYKWDLPESIGSELTLKEYICTVKQNYKLRETCQRAESKSNSAEKNG
jgi:hypothetical protein